jgi:methylated-DNA-[protein]-cysteine S-methyltransferase
MGLAQATMDTPVGPVSLTCSDGGLSGISFRRSRPADPGRTAGSSLLRTARDQLAEYFSGQRRTFDLPIDWSGVSRSRLQVLQVLFDTVGYGETITYGALARRAGLGEGGPDLPARAVGTIMGSNPWPLIVPCHRVVAGTGLGGYSGGTGIEIKRWLLIFEGALPATLDWDPAHAHGVR